MSIENTSRYSDNDLKEFKALILKKIDIIIWIFGYATWY